MQRGSTTGCTGAGAAIPRAGLRAWRSDLGSGRLRCGGEDPSHVQAIRVLGRGGEKEKTGIC